MVNGVAQIDQALCLGCRACVQVCPQGAIQVVSAATRPSPAAAPQAEIVPAGEGSTEPVPIKVRRADVVVPVQPRTSALRAAGTALAAVGTWLVPRLADALVAAVEHRFTSPDVSDRPPAVQAPPFRRAAGGRRQRLRRRSRGGR